MLCPVASADSRPIWRSGRSTHKQQRCAQSAHDDTGRLPNPLDQPRATFEARASSCRPISNDHIGDRVEDNGDKAEKDELGCHVSRGIDKLGDERQEKGRGFRIQCLDNDPIAEGSMGTGYSNIDPQLDPRFPNSLPAEPHEIGGSYRLECRKGLGACHDECRDADRAAGDMEEPTYSGPKARRQTRTSAPSQRACCDIEDARPRRDGEQQRRRQEWKKAASVKHECDSGRGERGATVVEIGQCLKRYCDECLAGAGKSTRT